MFEDFVPWATTKALIAVATSVIAVPLILWVWRKTIAPRRQRRTVLRAAGIDASTTGNSAIAAQAATEGQHGSGGPRKLVLFIHGLAGDAEGTWQRFPDLIRRDPDLSQLCDADTYSYPSEFVGPQPSLASIAKDLRDDIERRFSRYTEIAILAHSQGGLVAKLYIANAINDLRSVRSGAPPLRVRKLLTFATPHYGSIVATGGSKARIAGEHVKSLAIDSGFLQDLADTWARAQPEERLAIKSVIGGKDWVVGPLSARGAGWRSDYEVIADAGHTDIVKPESAEAKSFLIAKRFLLAPQPLIGAAVTDYRQPTLRLNNLEANGQNRFVYGARAIPMLGRDADVAKLGVFLAAPDLPFRWMVLYGSGGMGKSRLALELCLSRLDWWHAGFLTRDAQVPDWLNWQPLLPTLIVVDYAASESKPVRRMLDALSGRADADGTRPLQWPVRVLLIERTAGDWLDDLVGSGVEGKRIGGTQSESLELRSVPAWPIIEDLLKRRGKPLPDQHRTLDRLRQLDSEERPLFAYLVADAIAEGRDLHGFDRGALLDDVIGRWRSKFWRAMGAGSNEERLLALATMCGGLPVKDIALLDPELYPRWDIDRHPTLFAALTSRDASQRVAPLEPDVVGERFALGALSGEQDCGRNLSDDQRRYIVQTGQNAGGSHFRIFVVRSHRDHPGHPALPLLRQAPSLEALIGVGPDPGGEWIGTIDAVLRLGSKHDHAPARQVHAELTAVVRNADSMFPGRAGSLWAQWIEATLPLLADQPSDGPGREEIKKQSGTRRLQNRRIGGAA